jgi:hypothetical protein
MRGCQPALALGWAAIAEEPAALIGHGGVCEGGKPGEAAGFPLRVPSMFDSLEVRVLYPT